MLSPPIRRRARRAKTRVSEVFSERASVWSRLSFTASANVCFSSRPTVSRMRSKTTMESWTEKPITVSRALMNMTLISVPITLPRIEKMPTTSSTSCSSAMIAAAPKRNGCGTDRNAYQR